MSALAYIVPLETKLHIKHGLYNVIKCSMHHSMKKWCIYVANGDMKPLPLEEKIERDARGRRKEKEIKW